MDGRPLFHRDDGVTTVLGAVLVFAILTGALVYVNAYRVPEEGADWEREQARLLGGDVDRLAAVAARAHAITGPATVPLTVTPAAGTPNLLKGIVLDPRAPGADVTFDPDAAGVRVTHVTPDGNVVHVIGNASAPASFGRLDVTTHGHYIPPLAFTVEAGGAFQGADGSHHLTMPPAWGIRGDGDARTVTVDLVRFEGPAARVDDASRSVVTLAPLPGGEVGGAAPAASKVTIEVASAHATAWGAFLNDTFAPATADVRPRDGVAAITIADADGRASLALSVRVTAYEVRLG